MAQNLAGKSAAITGAASGIGLECARHLVAAGVKTFLVDRDAAALDKAKAELGDLAVPVVVSTSRFVVSLHTTATPIQST